jgi:hypothetical protein
VDLLKDVIVRYINKVPLCFRPYLSPIATRGELNTNKLGVIMRSRVMYSHKELRDVVSFPDGAVEYCIVLAPRAPLKTTLSADTFLIFQ